MEHRQTFCRTNVWRSLAIGVSWTTAWALLGSCGAVAQESQLPAKVGSFPQELQRSFTVADGLPSNDVLAVRITEAGNPVVRTASGFAEFDGTSWRAARAAEWAELFAGQLDGPAVTDSMKSQLNETEILSAVDSTAGMAIGTLSGLYFADDNSVELAFPADATRRWAPTQVHVATDSKQRLWFSSSQGAGCFDGQRWKLFAGRDGLPYEELTCVACGPEGNVWFGSSMGLIRFDGDNWFYRQGKRWLPGDEVRDVAIDAKGNAWVATDAGVANLYFLPMNLATKAKYYEQQIDKYHRRTEFEYVISGHAAQSGDKSNITLHTSDNDGLWTSMYGAGECFAYAATKSLKAKSRAQRAFRALRFLSEVSRGSEHEPPIGFIARSVLEVDGNENPNSGAYTLEQQRKTRERDGYWRVYEPRWPLSADEKYYWKSDTSSDELDGHYFFYPLYYDLVAETESEKEAARKIVRDNIDHLLSHDFSMHDHAGRTRWSVYGPDDMNQNVEWFNERGLKSLSILSYLNVAFHMTGDAKYRKVAKELRDKHAYHTNVMWPKYQFGLGSGNQSDDEMAFMCYYNLIKYEPDPQLRKMYIASFANSWRQEEPEMNPFFNFCFAAVAQDARFQSVWGEFDLAPWPSWIGDSVETLQRFPLDRFDWSHTNSHRTDIVHLSDHTADVFDNQVEGLGLRVNHKVIPVDERYFNHWNHSPWKLDTGGDGRTLGTGAVFTLPYYMGLYHGFIEVEEPVTLGLVDE